MTFGGEIVESFYDYDTQMIGPFRVPIHIHYDDEACSGNAFSVYKYYDLLNKEEDALAVFNVNNYCFCLLYKNAVKMRSYTLNEITSKNKELPCFSIEPELKIPTYKHVGWVKTYQKCKAVYTWPWKLLLNENTGDLWGKFEDKIIGEPLINPPLSLYKELVDTNYRGVYFDVKLNKPVFIN